MDLNPEESVLQLRHEAKEVGKGRTVARGLCLR